VKDLKLRYESIMKNTVFFTVGGVGYAIIELLWRGRTHWTMVIAGGICFIIFAEIAEKFKSKPALFKAALCALCVTLVELVFGVTFNIILKMGVWDYSHMPFNFLGQICALYTLMWGGLALLFLPLANALNGWMSGDGDSVAEARNE